MNKGEKLKNSVLQMAMEGKLVPQNSNDESAQVLVKKIFNKKTKMIKDNVVQDKTKPSLIYKTNGKYIEKSGKKTNDISEEIPFEIPESWSWVRLFSTADIYTGNSINKTEKETKYMGTSQGYNYIATKDVGFDNNIDYENGVKIPEGIDKFRIAYPGGILLCIEGGSAGRKIAFNEQKICFGNKLANFQTFEINNRFLFYYLQSPLFKDVFTSEISGIIGGVGVSKIRKMFLPIPPLEEQERITEKIEEVLPLVEKYGKLVNEIEHIYINEFPEKIRKSILQEAIQGKLTEQDPEDEPASILLEKIRKEKEKLIKEKKIKRNRNESMIYKENGHYYEKIGKEVKCIDDGIPFEIPENWAWCRLENLSENVHYGFTASAQSSGNSRLLRITDIQDNGVIWENVPFCSMNNIEFAKYGLNNNDILIARTGGTVGKSYIVNKLEEKAVFASYLIRIILLKNINENYLKLLFESPLYWNQLQSKVKGTGQPNVNATSLKNILITLPTFEEQKRIVDKIKEIIILINK